MITSTPTPTPPSTAPTSPAPAPARTRGKLVRGISTISTRTRYRHRSVDSVIVGILLTVLTISFDNAGWLSRIEFALYDARAALFQFFLPPATDKLIHLDLDDGTLRAIGRWPWPRGILAELMDELAVAGPKVVGLDILFSEEEPVTWKPIAQDTVLATQPSTRGVYVGPSKKIDNDAIFGESLKNLDCALVPMSLPFEKRADMTDVQRALRVELSQDINLPQATLVTRLRARGLQPSDLTEQVSREYLSAWRAEMFALIQHEVSAAPVSREVAKKRLLKLEKADLVIESAFDAVYDEAVSASYMQRFSQPIPADFPGLFSAQMVQLPVPKLAAAAKYSANVAFPRLPDGKVRAVPMFAKHHDRMYPQMGLMLACAQLGVDLSTLRYGRNSVVIPTPDGRQIVIPHRVYHSTEVGEPIATFIDIPWWGGERWEYMYDHQHRAPVNHISIVALWDIILTKRKVAINAASADAALIAVLDVVDEGTARAYAAKPPPPDDLNARRKVYEKNLQSLKDIADLVKSTEPKDLDQRSRLFLISYDSLPKLMTEFTSLEQRLREGRAEMKKRLGGKTVLIGWTATGVSADFVPTSLHASCPGVVLHGAIFNGIMTGELWRTLPQWVTFTVTGLVGICVTMAVAFMTPARALVVAALIMIGFVLIDGLVLFDYFNLILGAAGPMLCIAGVWQGGTLIRLIVERYQRSKIENRFRSYVDPALVDYVVENPEHAKLEGQVREMTVCFTDLGNFTPLTAKLKEATVPLLNRIFGAMVPEIRKHNGYVNKFLGDGIMFFFGAPRENLRHARDAIQSVLDIQQVMREINAELVEQGLTSVELRAGVNTGNMVVGDAGSEKASDYTVLGDDVNLASRMESANKQLGTTMLVSERTVQRAGNIDVVFRPVGQICVVGRDEPVVAFEILCRRADATEQQLRLVQRSRQLVETYRERKLQDCIRIANEMDQEFGTSKLTALYRERCEFFLGEGSSDPFDCTITLQTK